MGETQHHYPQQVQAHFIQSGTWSAEVCLDELLDANMSPNRELAKAHSLWPLLRCVAVALRVAVAAAAAYWMLAACLSDCVRCSWGCVCVVGATVVVLMVS